MVVFLCIDYTLWPGWNHRGVYLYSREPELKVSRSPTPSTHSLGVRVAILKHKA